MATATYTVTGMSCGHCVDSVSTHIGRIDGVEKVDVNLATGVVTVDSRTPLEDADVASAVEAAGYKVAG